ncbi:MAG: glycoside hydrolase domain-containing protein [Armatimonadia bacterium]
MLHPLTAVLLAILLLASVTVAPAKYPDDLPAPEKEMAGTVDPWGLPFSDALRRFEGRFTARPEARFAVGLTHDLVKVWPNKYWFRGDSALSAAAEPQVLRADTILAAAGETQAFQIAVLPRLGAADATYHLDLTLENPTGATARAFREYFVKTAEPGYPRFETNRWPDPLAPETDVPVTGTDCGAFWVDIALPANMPATTLEAIVKVTDGTETATIIVPIQVVPGLKLQPKDFPLVAWFRPKYGTKSLSPQQMLDMGGMVLQHHMQAMDQLKGLFKADDTTAFDKVHDTLARQGQNVFELDSPRPNLKWDYSALYNHVKKQGWLDQALIYSNVDEPLTETFYKDNVPWYQDTKAKYPGLRVFLASDYHEGMEKGCDIWMTDLSAAGYQPEKMRDLKAPTLWNYYCHLPIHLQFRAPLTMAPNMEVDNEALQHRLALWMSDYYGARGVFIWAGFSAGGLKDDFWQTLELESKPGGYPYGGLHNGNNFLVYPPQSDGGPVLPSVRLKVLRAGMQDLALLRTCRQLLAEGKIKGSKATKLKQLINPVPTLFTHPQYWDRLPETLLTRRQQILEVLASR